MVPPELKKLLLHQKYKLVGRNAAAKICQWTKYSIEGKGSCYKEKFYNIKSHRCVQCTPCVNVCTHNCLFCWRATNFTQNEINDPDDPKDIVEGVIEAQRKMLSGLGGYEKTDRKKFEEAQYPNQAAISLSGEVTLYPFLPELIEEFKKRNFTTFVVSNGTNPKMLEKIKPTQLYVTLAAPNEEIYKKTCAPLIKDGWKKINESLELLSSLSGARRTVVRLTLVRGLNMKEPKEYAKLIERSNANYCEVKAYMAVGFSRERLGLNYMPRHEEIKKFAEEIASESGYLIVDEHQPSRVVLLCRDEVAKRNIYLSQDYS